MSTFSDKIERHYILEDFENKLKRKSSCRNLKLLRTDDDKRTRREVANNNERRRMQSINAGFESLRKLLPFCSDKEKISKATILQSTVKYIADLRLKINSLENDVLRLTNSENISMKNNSLTINSDQRLNEDKIGQNLINQLILNPENEKCTNSKEIKEEMQSSPMEIVNIVNSSSNSELGSSLSSSMIDNLSSVIMNLNSEDDITSPSHSFPITNESIDFSQQQQNNLEQLLAAVEQVERLEAMHTISLNDNLPFHYPNRSTEIALNLSPQSLSNSSSNLDTSNFVVMKPTISPYAEKIIQDAVNMKLPYNKLSSSIIVSNSSFILPMNCSNNYITQSMQTNVNTKERMVNHNNPIPKIFIPNNYTHRDIV